ncbi:MAG: thiamine-phosphate kinase [Pyrinomonadaceae bacterium]
MKSEFQFIKHLKERFSLSYTGDDCAVLPKDQFSDLLITADLLIEDIDFRLDWSKPAYIGYKSLAVSLSDIAAMGGTPTFALLSLGVPERLWNDKFLEDFYEGWHFLAKRFGIELVGGDISSTADKLAIDSIVLGEVPKGNAIRRSGAKPGDVIFVSGTIGGAVGGLRLLESKEPYDASDDKVLALVQKQLRPLPQIDLGKQLRELGIVTAMIDISDGISSDIAHICEASAVGAALAAEKLPIDPDLTRAFPDRAELLDLALNGGEDFELLITIDPDKRDLIANLPVAQVGTITERIGVVELVEHGSARELRPQGFQHF